MSAWLANLNALLNDGKRCVLVTVAHTAASAPRAAGTKMLVSPDNIYDTIGGGNLEYKAIETARSLLANNDPEKNHDFLELYALGPMLEQCCGGVVFLHYELINKHNCAWVKLINEIDENSGKAIIITRTGKQDSERVKSEKLIVTEFESLGSLGELTEDAINNARQLLKTKKTDSYSFLQSLSLSKGSLPDINDALLFEVLRPCDFHISLFGAGHVGRAIVDVLEKSLNCRISWVDSRSDAFPETLPVKVKVHNASMPTGTVEDMPANSFYLVMTHSHALDLALCEAVLKRGDFQYLGLIGSDTKYRRFHKQLLTKGITETELSRLTCPIGINGIDSKEPGAIAVSVVAQLIQVYEANRSAQSSQAENNNVYSI